MSVEIITHGDGPDVVAIDDRGYVRVPRPWGASDEQACRRAAEWLCHSRGYRLLDEPGVNRYGHGWVFQAEEGE